MTSALLGAVAAVAVMGAFSLAGPAQAEDSAATAVRQGTVVELYTSQGCSACPPADDYLRELAAQPGVIALSLHVDYWDYIGWVDSFGQKRFTERQKAYARAGGARTIYTPQMIVAGAARVEGVNPEAVDTAIKADQAAGAQVVLKLERRGDKLAISAAPRAGLSLPIRVQLVRFTPRAQVMIEAGENAGKLVDYANVVTSWARLGEWDGMAALSMSADVPGSDGIVVILQEVTVKDLPGRILGAAASE